MNSEEDQRPYKSKGVITMKIEKLSEFAQQAADNPKWSEPVYIRGLPWKILVLPQEKRDDATQKCLGYFAQCNTQNNLPIWGCVANVTFIVLARKKGKRDDVQKLKFNFHANQNNWGFPEFRKLEELMDADNGWYDESTDSITLCVEIEAEDPYGIDVDSKFDEQMGSLLDKGAQFADCTLMASDGKEFKVHKCILACRSRVFAAMFEHEGMSESKEGIVKIKDIKSEVLEQMLRFIYSGMAPNLEEVARELLIAAEKYELEKLKELCERVLAHSLGIENACELLLLANRHSAAYLKGQAFKHIQQHAKKVMDSDGWNLLLQENDVNLMNEIVKTVVAEK